MIRVSALERLLQTSRVRRRTTPSGFAVPGAQTLTVSEEDGPFVVSLTRPGFTQSRIRTDDGLLWAGFQECPLEEEGAFLSRLYSFLWDLSISHGWNNRASSIEDGLQRLSGFGYEPTSMVVAKDLLDVPLEEAERLMALQGHVLLRDGVQVQIGDLPAGAAILTPGISLTGSYTRVDDHLAVAAYRVSHAWVLVGGSGAVA